MNDTTGVLGAASVIGVLVPMMWYMLREIRAALNGVSREMSDLTLMIALEVATRPAANDATKEIASRFIHEREGKH